ncbi:MAG: Ni/Fe hydrogenase subunit alpha [Candidatus Odinarchaeum yellowstonii]|uniref:Ni/Fe hydrogenase subunit alpha n=1 Tax=Odinarchaeota yellowstonii (strain LCB_4) TaxID=1841599 RepID=A0AAF0D387_ODILC|nr:MAG: Ni/Fe hydrogenase subunit alpha [Candidatus Odinarchaeum yellowstonii]
MSKTLTIEELTRVEGHGGITIIIEGETVKDVKMNIFEGPRFFESIIKTVYYDKIPDIMRRICAICTASHSLASIRAIEHAFNIDVSDQTQILRDLLIHGETIESHALHVFMLALPDYLGYPDALKMASDHLDKVKAALELKKAGNLIHNTISGREVHGMNERVGGFSRIPSERKLENIREEMLKVKAAAELGVELLARKEPQLNFNSKNIFMALNPGEKYGFIGDEILISDGSRHNINDYLNIVKERVVNYSTSKISTYKNHPFMVGALARLILNKNKLEGTAKTMFKKYQQLIREDNPLSNNIAQAIELVHSVERAEFLVNELLSRGVRDEHLPSVKVKEARGVGAVEAPRGILYHDYTFDKSGCVIKCNVITPTAQNIANMEKHYREIVEALIKEEENMIKRHLELVARAYDPCISCSTHIIRVKR